jgi:long-chain acyl-CoA synthetase
MCAVPRIYDTIKKGALEKVNGGGKLTKWIFETALKAKKVAAKNGRDTPLWNLLVFNKFKENLGGRTTRLISGGAPLSAESQEFLRLAFGAVVVQGYGLTETCAGGTVQDVNEPYFVTLNVGAPIPSCQIKLIDVPDMKYFSSNTPPQGEICIKGLNVNSKTSFNL